MYDEDNDNDDNDDVGICISSLSLSIGLLPAVPSLLTIPSELVVFKLPKLLPTSISSMIPPSFVSPPVERGKKGGVLKTWSLLLLSKEEVGIGSALGFVLVGDLGILKERGLFLGDDDDKCFLEWLLNLRGEPYGDDIEKIEL